MVAPNGQATPKRTEKDKGKSVSSYSQLAQANRRRAASAATVDPTTQTSRDSALLKRKYGRAIGARYDGNGRLIPADYMSMVTKEIGKSSENRPLKKRRSQRDTQEIEVIEPKAEPKAEPEAEEITKEAILEINETEDFDENENNNDENDDEDDEDEDWEEVDLESQQKLDFLNLENEDEGEKNDEITISLDKDEFDEEAKTRRKRRSAKPTLSREEKEERILIHKLHLSTLLVHVSMRNKWCSDFKVRQFFKRLIPEKIMQELHPLSAALSENEKGVNLSQMVMTRKLLDGLRHIMELWKKQFRIKGTCGLRLTSWADIFSRTRKVESAIDKKRFIKLLSKFRGSRDVGAQGFCALLRAADIDARLVCSLQPLDFTSNIPIGELTDADDAALEEDPAGQSEYPVYWVEVWDSFSQKWIAIDPVVLGIVEPASIRRKSKFEPPLSDKFNLMRYVIAFDEDGTVHDVTRRYSYYFNAKTRKKRITKFPEGAVWYSNLLKCYSRRYKTDRDILEEAEMEERSQAEEIPSSIQDFKGHPLYVLERHLHQNEVIDSKESCGFLAVKNSRTKNTKKNIPGGKKTPSLEKIYRRRDVKLLRSARGWYQLGRVIKPGAQPLKHVVRKKTPSAPSQQRQRISMDENEEDNDLFSDTLDDDALFGDDEVLTGLYSVDQTDLYVPPPITDGKVVRNAYGNIDVYVPSMVPAGGVLLRYPHIAVAAKMVGIDYANAVTGFDFGGNGAKSSGGKRTGGRGTATARIDGIVIAKEYEEAVRLVYEQLLEEQEEENKEMAIARALMTWRRYVIALRIKARLERDHGVIKDENQSHSGNEPTLNMNPSINNEHEGGGFVSANEPSKFQDEEHKYLSGGFADPSEADGGFLEEENSKSPHLNYGNEGGGGFLDENESGGGFMDEHEPGGFMDESELGGGFMSDGTEGGGFIDENEDQDKNSPVKILNTEEAEKEHEIPSQHKAPDIKEVVEPDSIIVISDDDITVSKSVKLGTSHLSDAIIPTETITKSSKQPLLRKKAPLLAQDIELVVIPSTDHAKNSTNPASSSSTAPLQSAKVSGTPEILETDIKDIQDLQNRTNSSQLTQKSEHKAVETEKVHSDSEVENKKDDEVEEVGVTEEGLEEEEDDFFPDSMSESELYQEYDEEDVM